MTHDETVTRDGPRAELTSAVEPHLTAEAARWLSEARERIAATADAAATVLPAVGRRCGRGPLDAAGPGPAGWSVDDAARVLLLLELPCTGDTLAARLTDLYRYGDAGERRGVLRSLAAFDAELGDGALPLVHDALRTNDTRLVAAALGPYGGARLADHAWRQAVLKCVFVGVPLAVVDGLDRRADAELARMMADYAQERAAAGRDVPADVAMFLDDPPAPDTRSLESPDREV
ncbi:EboA domain-containing protein [Actinomadura sp. HBU206391]|nr:EboA domain-containing protein [Actinomadura sp. HBU206391]